VKAENGRTRLIHLVSVTDPESTDQKVLPRFLVTGESAMAMMGIKPVVPPSFVLRCWKCGSTDKCAMQEVIGYSRNGWPKSGCCQADVGLFAEVERPISDQLLIAKVTDIQSQKSN
jgi:hypothetical protein